jgi:hypothetical protein
MFIETEVTLRDGRRVKAYYLDEEGLKLLNELRRLPIHVENLELQVENLQQLLKAELKERLREEFIRNLVLTPSQRSFRYAEFLGTLREKMKLHLKYTEIIDELFEEAVKDGRIEERGSGWYRSKAPSVMER